MAIMELHPSVQLSKEGGKVSHKQSCDDREELCPLPISHRSLNGLPTTAVVKATYQLADSQK